MRPPGGNNPWGFQAQNWNMPITRGPPPQQFSNQHGPNMQQNRFYSPNAQQAMVCRHDHFVNYVFLMTMLVILNMRILILLDKKLSCPLTVAERSLENLEKKST